MQGKRKLAVFLRIELTTQQPFRCDRRAQASSWILLLQRPMLCSAFGGSVAGIDPSDIALRGRTLGRAQQHADLP
jgi:hypothetical protein